MTREQGKTLAESRAEMTSIVELFRWYSGQATRPTTRVEPGSVPGGDVTVRHLPVGPVAILTPWNFPASLAARKLAAAFAVGCTAVVKPAPETPASFLAVARALMEAGLPDGVLNVVNGDPVRISRELIESPHIRAVSFTGSTAVGREIGRLAAGAVTRATLELGGHAPVIVTGDVDVEAAARTLAVTKYRNAGQVCISPTRFLVEQPGVRRVPRPLRPVRHRAAGRRRARRRCGDGADGRRTAPPRPAGPPRPVGVRRGEGASAAEMRCPAPAGSSRRRCSSTRRPNRRR